MLGRIFNKLRLKMNTVRQEIIIDKTATKKYLDTECNLYRYSKFNYHSDKNDELYKFTEGFHTIPVNEEVEFEEAASQSISFNANHEDF